MLRRFVPLLAILGVSLSFLLARLWDIQIVQHEVWSTEAVNLVRSHGVTPYVRGALRDRHGALITRDEEIYALEFVWRDFRRGHPLGQVAMMRSLMMMRPVGLDEARPQLGEAALAYASLTPKKIETFEDGGELDAGIDFVPALAAVDEDDRLELAIQERRGPRAGDLRYYILRMLRLSPREIKTIGEMVEDGQENLTYLELAAKCRAQTLEEAIDGLHRDVIDADVNLSRLSEQIEWETEEDEDGISAVASRSDRLVPLIEERRREVDDETADALFRIASGFSSMRISSASLERFDLRWLRTALDWDERRLQEWRDRRGGSFREAAELWMAGTMIARAKIGDDQMWSGDRILSAYAHAFRTGADAWARANAMAEDWRKVDEIDVVTILPERLAVGDQLDEGLLSSPTFPFQMESLRTAGLEGPELVLESFRDTITPLAEARWDTRDRSKDRVRTVRTGRLFKDASRDEGVEYFAKRVAGEITRVAEKAQREWGPEEEKLYRALLVDGYERLQVRLTEILDAAVEATPQAQRAAGLSFGEVYVDKALETRRYAIRDRGARPRVVGGEPRKELVLLVTRYSDDFAGFRVASKSRRVPIALGPDGVTPLASKLIGAVRSQFLVEVMQGAPEREELSSLARKYKLPASDHDRILGLLDAAFLGDEAIGGAGLEAWLDEELSGTSGYVEIQGLQDRVEGNRPAIYRPKVDGEDVTLTLDIALQTAAERVLQNPEPAPEADLGADDLWTQSPVGAIVLVNVRGEILAAGSVPVKPGQDVGPPVTDGERASAIDRTLRRPRGQAPGSVVKPLLAAYALEYLSLDPGEGLAYCDSSRPRQGLSPKKDNHAGYGIVNCASRYGHTSGGRPALAMREALRRSCNAYFAALGEVRFDEHSIRKAYDMFGFGRPTGVRYQDDGKRRGLVDSYWYNSKSPLSEDPSGGRPGPVDRQYLGNGLIFVDANVVQMARAYAGLATGYLPEMSLVKKVGDKPTPQTMAAIGIGDEHLSLVREALDSAVREAGGTGHNRGLSEGELGFRLAAKTGSADYRPGLVPGYNGRFDPIEQYRKGMRKHTWVAGWFPVEEPQYVVVVYLHDTSATASRSAVYVAGQFLRTPEVRALMGVAEEEEEE